MASASRLLLFALVFCTSGNLFGNAFCALRDPVHALDRLYPDKTHVRSIVRKIDQDEKANIASRFPFTIHRKELGDHTIYLAFKNKGFLGIVHVRSEQSRWGLIEIAWAIDPSLKKITAFSMQRCRDPKRQLVQDGQFQAFINGKTAQEIAASLTADGRVPKNGVIDYPEDAYPLLGAMMRSAVKTLTITDNLYRKDINKIVGNVDATP